MAAKLDLYRKHRTEYVARRAPVLVTVGPAGYLAVDGGGDPKAPAFQVAIGGLYSLAFTIKMAKKLAGRDYAVAKMEGLWWGGEPGRLLIDSAPRTWKYRLMIRVPSFITARDRRAALAVLKTRGKDAAARRVKLIALTEGRCVQMLHVGPYDAEGDSIARMKAFARDHGYALGGRHHEIYLSDPRRVPAARLKTILRYPVRKR